VQRKIEVKNTLGVCSAERECGRKGMWERVKTVKKDMLYVQGFSFLFPPSIPLFDDEGVRQSGRSTDGRSCIPVITSLL